MPTYVYHCLDCGDNFEEFQKITDPALDTCPKCKGKIERVITGGAGFLFKGDGFYITDYRNEQYKKDAAADTGGKAGSSPPSVKQSKKAQPKPSADTRSKASQAQHRGLGKKGT